MTTRNATCRSQIDNFAIAGAATEHAATVCTFKQLTGRRITTHIILCNTLLHHTPLQ